MLSAGHVEHLRIIGVVSDYGLHFDEDWTDEHVALVHLFSASADVLRRAERLRGDEVTRWTLLGDDGVVWRERPSAEVPTTPVVSLAEAIVRLLTGELEHPPPGYWWAFGFQAEPSLIAMRIVPGASG